MYFVSSIVLYFYPSDIARIVVYGEIGRWWEKSDKMLPCILFLLSFILLLHNLFTANQFVS